MKNTPPAKKNILFKTKIKIERSTNPPTQKQIFCLKSKIQKNIGKKTSWGKAPRG